MSNVISARPYVPRAHAVPLEPQRVALPEASLALHPNVIGMQPPLSELTPSEIVERVRPYMAATLLLLAAMLAAQLFIKLVRRYRSENDSGVRSVAMDRRSLRRAQRGASIKEAE